MIELSEFLLKSSIILLAFYLGYVLVLKKNTHFKLNRFYLLSGLLLSLLVPFLHFSLPKEYPNEVFVTLDSIQVNAVYQSVKPENVDYFEILYWLYYAGTLVLLLRLFLQFYFLLKLYLKSQKETISGKTIFLTDKNSGAFSFFGLIFMNRQERDSEEFNAILRHENVHIVQKHSVDILLAELLTIVLWFNPFSWLYLKNIKANHEFLADEGVVNTGFSANRYVEILFEQSSGLRFGLANNFNQSLTFKRLNMMKKIRSSKITKLKVLITLPVIIAMVIFVSCSKELLDVNKKKASEVNGKTVKMEKSVSDNEIFFVVDEMPQYPGGELALRKYIAMNVKYPQEARQKGIEGKVYVRFAVTKTGAVDSVKIARGVNPILNKEALRVIKSLPKWQAAKHKGAPVNVWFTLPINFSLDNNIQNNPDKSIVTADAKNQQAIEQSDEHINTELVNKEELPSETFFVVEKMPEFQGKEAGLRRFLAENLKYPAEAVKNKVEGKAYIMFRVTDKGTVDKVSVAKSSGNKLLDEEAMKVVKLTSEKWTPGEQKGKKVNIWFTVPIQFRLK